MGIKKIILTLIFLFSSILVIGQGFMYSFTDPCTFKTKQIYINNPNGNIALIYNGQIKSFTPQDLINGALQQWVAQVNSTNPNGPCSGVGLAENTSINALVAQNTISVLTTVLSVLSDLSDLSSLDGGATTVDGVIGTNEKSSKEDKKKNNNTGDGGNNSNTNTTTNNNGVITNNTGTKTDSKSETDNTSGSGAETNNTNQNGNQETKQPVNNQDNIKANSINGIVSSTQAKEKVANVKKGSLMMTGDVVVIRSASTTDKDQLKINLSVITSNTKNTFAKGVLGNFTTSINNSCLTLFAAYRMKKITSIVANSSMLNFQKDFFNTTSVMESYKFWKLTSTLGINLTVGKLGESNFKSISSLGGFVGSFNLNKKIGITPMFVMVYSPYVYYYQGIWYKSGWLAVPFMAVDYKLTKKFKFNLSFSGVQQLNSSTLNFQLLIGAKALL